MKTHAPWLAPVAAACCISCSSSPFSPPYDPVIPGAWASSVTNTYFPLAAGTTWQYRAETSDGVETTNVEVLPDSKTVNGVRATVVRDRVYLNGVLIEDTFDWFAQDAEGNVWYVGEDTKEYDKGVVTSTEGSWEWGVSGALPGIQMWADPAAHMGNQYRQEYLKGKAEDWARVISTGDNAAVPYGNFSGCVTIEEWTGLDRETHEAKVYCPEVGNVSEGSLGKPASGVLISRTSGSS